MYKKKEHIYIQQWLELKPYEKQVSTDSYYLKICNQLKNAIISNKHSFVLQRYLDNDEINILSCFLTSYFEDLISETNIWNAFINHHTELYNKQLPFFNLDGYFPEEINVQDVSFLIWYFMNTIQKDKFIAPFNDFIYETALKIMDVFEEAWEYAPENETLKAIYTIDENETDFYIARNLIDTILFKTYLFYPDTLLDLKDAEMEILEEDEINENIVHYLNENRDQTIHREYTRLLSLKGKDWASKILGENHPLSEWYPKMSQKIRGYFLYKGQDDNDIFIEHIASGKKFNLTKKSFDHSKSLSQIDTIIYMGIAMWRDEWWFSGVFFTNDFNADLILDEKNSIESRMAVNFLDHQEKDVEDLLEKQFIAFKSFAKGSQIAFVASSKVDDFVKGYTEHFNASLKLSKKEKEKAKQSAKDDGFFGTEDKHRDFTEVSESALVFFNPQSGAEVALAVNSAFPDKNNPFFNSNESEDHIMRLLLAEELSKELVMYCIDNYKSALPFFNEYEGEMYLKDIDFLLRFWKKNNYHAKPSVTFTGGNK
ncbi:MAG: DUF3843 family protein [Salinivirgaceae bacterium]|jgi:hypothetical protein|nr:DUF3843 family protein [Salinivirgaceae bacterium]